ncbi:MAG TPA: glutamate--cysteine ligase [Nocardioides sp.]|nr:glutamate--cysteine ligase [Nocardioides sp.]
MTATLPDAAPDARGAAPGPDGAPTVGVEEELALLDPRTGAVVTRAPEVIRDCRDETGVAAEAMTYMVETRTPVCRDIEDVRAGISSARRRVADVARHHGAVCVATGTVPFGVPARVPLTPDPRYLELARRFPFAISTAGSCGCHVHVGVPDRDIGVGVLLRIRRWLPALVALTANSPFWDGIDTGWASHRFLHTARWPTAVPPPPVRTAGEYDDLVAHVVAAGRAFDPRSVYFLARLSPRYPTVEVRVADVALTAEETVGYAALVRALVATAAAGAASGAPVRDVPQGALRAACRTAAVVGLAGRITDPCTGARVPAWDLVDALVAEVRPRLCAHGDADVVRSTLGRLRREGGGADRQRRLLRSARSPAALVAALAAATEGGV